MVQFVEQISQGGFQYEMTKETFQVTTRDEAENMVMNFQKSAFPKLLSYSISEEDGNIILIVEKEFGEEFNKIKFN